MQFKLLFLPFLPLVTLGSAALATAATCTAATDTSFIACYYSLYCTFTNSATNSTREENTSVSTLYIASGIDEAQKIVQHVYITCTSTFYNRSSYNLVSFLVALLAMILRILPSTLIVVS